MLVNYFIWVISVNNKIVTDIFHRAFSSTPFVRQLAWKTAAYRQWTKNLFYNLLCHPCKNKERSLYGNYQTLGGNLLSQNITRSCCKYIYQTLFDSVVIFTANFYPLRFRDRNLAISMFSYWLHYDILRQQQIIENAVNRQSNVGRESMSKISSLNHLPTENSCWMISFLRSCKEAALQWVKKLAWQSFIRIFTVDVMTLLTVIEDLFTLENVDVVFVVAVILFLLPHFAKLCFLSNWWFKKLLINVIIFFFISNNVNMVNWKIAIIFL